jgi:hypothetical protein
MSLIGREHERGPLDPGALASAVAARECAPGLGTPDSHATTIQCPLDEAPRTTLRLSCTRLSVWTAATREASRLRLTSGGAPLVVERYEISSALRPPSPSGIGLTGAVGDQDLATPHRAVAVRDCAQSSARSKSVASRASVNSRGGPGRASPLESGTALRMVARLCSLDGIRRHPRATNPECSGRHWSLRELGQGLRGLTRMSFS